MATTQLRLAAPSLSSRDFGRGGLCCTRVYFHQHVGGSDRAFCVTGSGHAGNPVLTGLAEIWLTKIFNDYVPGVGNAFLGLVGIPAQPRPWADFVTMQLLVVAIIVVLFAFLRTRLSVDRPGTSPLLFRPAKPA